MEMHILSPRRFPRFDRDMQQSAWKTHTIPYLDLPLFGVPNDDSVSGVSIHDPLGSEWHPNWKVLVSIIVLNRISYKNGTRTCPNCKSVAYMVWANQLCGTVPLCFFFSALRRVVKKHYVR